VAGERRRARDLSAEFSQTARRQRETTAEPAASASAGTEPALNLASVAAGDLDTDFSGGQPYARLYVSWDAADRLDTEYRALRRRMRGRVSKLQLLDALLAVAFRHPEEVLAELKAQGRQRGASE
jgi:hypothetical protein